MLGNVRPRLYQVPVVTVSFRMPQYTQYTKVIVFVIVVVVKTRSGDF